jgi:hypothetical protein
MRPPALTASSDRRWRGMRPQSKEYPVKRFIPISRIDRVVQHWYTPLPQVGQPGPILGESMPNQSLMRG